MKPALIANLFYANGPTVALNRKPPRVLGHIIYSSLNPLTIAKTNDRQYQMKEGEVLEIAVNYWRLPQRRFFQFDFVSQKWKELLFEEKGNENETEGEYVLLKHFGLLGKERVNEAVQYLSQFI